MNKILVATGLYPPDIGGPATYARMLETQLPKFGFAVEVFAFGEVRNLPKIVRHIAYAFKLRQKLKQTEADVIYALDPISVGLPVYLVSKITGKKFLVRLGGDYAWEQGRIRFGLENTLDQYTSRRNRRPLMVSVLAWLQIFVVKRAELVILPSEYLKSVVKTWGVEESKIKVIYSALFPLPVSESKATLRDKLSYDGLVLITAARLTPWKGVDCLLQVVAQLNAEGLKTTLVVAGDGEARPLLEATAAQLKITDQVRFVGKLSKEALGAAVVGADIFILNTSYEGLPHQLLEIMDLGVPIITTNIAGNREIITDGKEALLVDPNDLPTFVSSVKKLADNESLQRNLVKNAKEQVKRFDQSVVIKDLVKVLNDLPV